MAILAHAVDGNASFAQHGCNLGQRAWFIDQAHAQVEGMSDLLAAVREVALDVRVLGAYPAAVL